VRQALTAALVAASASAAVAGPAQAQAGAGTVEAHDFGASHYVLYTPSSYDASRPAPLVVMIHGCNTTAEQQMHANAAHALADREGFVILYPDNDDDLHPAQCWRFYSPLEWRRDSSDVAAIAGMTRTVMAARAIDPERVYAIGMSSGAFTASNLGPAYPDLYAAIGVMAGSAYSDFTCVGTGLGRDVSDLARGAHAAMGPRARVLPFIVLHGDADAGIPPRCGERAVQQALRTANLAAGSRQDGPIALAPASTRSTTKPGGRAYDVRTYADPDGCVVGEHWIVHGMGHFWSGGTTDPRYAGFTDPTGPSASDAAWAFFKRFRRAETSLPCAEASPPPALSSTSCSPRRSVVLTLARPLRSARVTVGGRALRVRRGGGRLRVTVDLRGRSGKVRVRITGRTPSGRTLRTTRVVRVCV
jgi:poly(hydroxyalkanoate) depolymerase family esterase